MTAVSAATAATDKSPFASLRGYTRYAPTVGTFILLVLSFVGGSFMSDSIGSSQSVYDVLRTQAPLIVIAVGMTFVIITGGIDLSVGSMMAFGGMLYATLIQGGWSWSLAMIVVLTVGTVIGAGMGAIIHYFEVQPFIVTLGGLFLGRGLTFVLSLDRKSIAEHEFTADMSRSQVALPGGYISNMTVIALIFVVIAAYLLASTRFGRTVYALGGSEQSAVLMGLSVARTKIGVYAFSGFCAAFGGLLFSLALRAGDTAYGVGWELDAIAAVVIGGALLTGGTGYIIGTLFGVMTLGIIQKLIFANNLNAWWAKIAVGVLLLIFILLQRSITSFRRKPA